MKSAGYKWYLLALAVMLALSGLYAVRRDLPERYRNYQRSEEAVRQAAANVAILQSEVELARRKLKDLDTDVVEMEATVRRIKRLVREGETVYRFEPAPSPAVSSQP